ncbi:MAG: ChaN family lipoprotein [Candidatus Aegiribacteria sp.]
MLSAAAVILGCAVCAVGSNTGGGEAPPGTIYAGDSTVTAEEMLQALAEADVVFVGEKHDDPLAHRWELFIWSSLASSERALALEMFETDVQGLLDCYLAGEVSGEEFMEGSRPWGNYPEAYAPMVDLAAEHGYRVIAANVPRSFASRVARGGWEALEGEEFFEDLTVDSSSAGYRERFLATMEDLGGQMHSMPMSPMNMYRAQLLKDAVMAASVDGVRCVFVCGSFHSDYRAGIPDQLPPGTSFMTVKILGDEETMDPELADFVVVR